jgi:hypothetical protein
MTKPSLPSCVMSLAAFMLYIPRAQAYIDPGIAYGLIQAAFALLFGGAVAWVLRPWTYLKGLFRAKPADDKAASSSSQGHSGEGKSR